MTINPTLPTIGAPRGSEETDVLNALSTLVDAVNKGLGLAVVTSLPVAPTDGQEVIFMADTTNGVAWHLKYRSSSPQTSKWEFIGGGSLYTRLNNEETVTSAIYVELATPVRLTVPLRGRYEVEHGASITPVPAVSGETWQVPSIGAPTDGDARALRVVQHDAGTPRSQASSSMVSYVDATGAGDVALWYRSTGLIRASYRWMRIKPLRVG